jgi:hypothetical protein
MGAVEHLKTFASRPRCQPWRAAGNGRKLVDAANDNALVTSRTRRHDLESNLSYRPVGICQDIIIRVNNYVDGSELLSLGLRVVLTYIRHPPMSAMSRLRLPPWTGFANADRWARGPRTPGEFGS